MAKTINSTQRQWWPPTALQSRRIIAQHSTQSTKVVAGKRIPSKRVGIDRKGLALFFIFQLNDALEVRAREEEKFWRAGQMKPYLAKAVANFHSAVIAAVDKTLLHTKAGAPPTLSAAKGLLPIIKAFKIRCNACLEAKNSRQLSLAICLNDLCEDVEHYILQTKITFNVVAADGGKPALNNRPTKTQAKAQYASIVQSHQQTHGLGFFPKPRFVVKDMAKAGYSVSARTLNDWKRQIQTGTFDLYVQPKKRQ